MIRSELKRAGFARKLPAEPKPPKGPKSRLCAVKTCRKPFIPARSFQRFCGPDCGAVLAMEKLAKQKAKAARADRVATKAKLLAQKPLQYHLKRAEKVINLYVRLRDRLLGCCSCNKPSHWDGQWHASHFKSVGSNSVLRYNLWNIQKGCSECNNFKSGNIMEYERRLIHKIGADRVEWLKCQNGVRKYTQEYLIRLHSVFTKKCKRLTARLNIGD